MAGQKTLSPPEGLSPVKPEGPVHCRSIQARNVFQRCNTPCCLESGLSNSFLDQRLVDIRLI
jgi:hypothetical protein